MMVKCMHAHACTYIPPSVTGMNDVNGTRDVVKRALTEEEARFYMSEIVAALEWVHLHGYVYR